MYPASESRDRTQGASIAGVHTNSTQSDNNNNTRTNINSGVNVSQGESFNSRLWSDINGDGLPDRIRIFRNEIRVQLNLGFTTSNEDGYLFSDELIWGSGYSDLYVSTRNNESLGGGISSPSWAFGFGLASSTARLNASLVDVNGDGLPDLVKRASALSYVYHLNKGNGFDTEIRPLFNGHIDQDNSLTGNIYGSFTYGFPYTLIIYYT